MLPWLFGVLFLLNGVLFFWGYERERSYEPVLPQLSLGTYQIQLFSEIDGPSRLLQQGESEEEPVVVLPKRRDLRDDELHGEVTLGTDLKESEVSESQSMESGDRSDVSENSLNDNAESGEGTSLETNLGVIVDGAMDSLGDESLRAEPSNSDIESDILTKSDSSQKTREELAPSSVTTLPNTNQSNN